MNVNAGDWRHYQGDSITQGGSNDGGFPWHAPPGGLDDLIQATWGPAPAAVKTAGLVTGNVGAVTGAAAGVVATVPGYKTTIVTSSGSGGANSTQLAALLPSTCFLMVPAGLTSPMILLGDGINDALQIWAGARTLAEFQTGKTSQYTQILARWPAARIVELTCLCGGEVHMGGLWGSNFFDAQILAVDNAKKVLAASFGAEVIDNRAALLAWEIINNPGQAAGGFAVRLEGNNAHPTYDGMIEVMAAEFLATITVVP